MSRPPKRDTTEGEATWLYQGDVTGLWWVLTGDMQDVLRCGSRRPGARGRAGAGGAVVGGES